MNRAYLSFLSSLICNANTTVCEENPYGTLIHQTHGATFGISVSKEYGMFLGIIKDSAAIEGIDAYFGSAIPANLAPYEGQTLPVSSVRSTFHKWGDNAVFSVQSEADDVTLLQTVFAFDGGIAILGNLIYPENMQSKDPTVPLHEIAIQRCFADPEKMKVYKNTTTHGGILYRTLMDDNRPIRSIRPISANGETKNIFSYSLSVTPAYPCYALEVTSLGMAFTCQLLSNNPTCQALLLQDGTILSYNPQTGILQAD